MLGIKKALAEFKKCRDDPYAVLPETNIELRFDNEGNIIAAYDANPGGKAGRWRSDEFEQMLRGYR